MIYRLQGLQFEWDDDKAESNAIKHGVRFEEAAEVFFDPFYQMGDATGEGVAEQRDFILGYSVLWKRTSLALRAAKNHHVMLNGVQQLSACQCAIQ